MQLNIITLHYTLETPSLVLLVLEYVRGDDLFYCLEERLDYPTVEPIAQFHYQIVLAIIVYK